MLWISFLNFFVGWKIYLLIMISDRVLNSLLNTICFDELFLYLFLPRCMHWMQTRSNGEKAVCPSVCLSVKCVNCDKTKERSLQIFIPYERTFSLVFWGEEWLVGATPSTWNFGSTGPRWSDWRVKTGIYVFIMESYMSTQKNTKKNKKCVWDYGWHAKLYDPIVKHGHIWAL